MMQNREIETRYDSRNLESWRYRMGHRSRMIRDRTQLVTVDSMAVNKSPKSVTEMQTWSWGNYSFRGNRSKNKHLTYL